MDLNINNPEQIKQLIAMLQQMLPKEDQQQDTNSEEIISKIRTKTIRSDKISKQKNKFLEMPERNLHKADSEIDKKLSVSPPTPRNRKFIPVEVSCRICGRKEQVNPAILPDSKDRYRCNKCSSSGGD